MQRGQICNASIGHRGMARPWPEPRWTGEGGPEPAQNCTAAQRQARMRRHTRVRVATVTLPPPLAWPRTRHRARPPTLKRCPSQRLADHDLSAGDLPAGARHTAASRGTVPTTPADPDGAASSRQSHRLRRPSTTPPPFHAHPHRAVPPHRHLSRPLCRPPSRPVSTCSSITRPSLRTISPMSLLCAIPLSLLWG